jgi:hypothetical protein
VIFLSILYFGKERPNFSLQKYDWLNWGCFFIKREKSGSPETPEIERFFFVWVNPVEWYRNPDSH